MPSSYQDTNAQNLVTNASLFLLYLLPSGKSSFCFFSDEDSNGSIDKEELRKCLHKLETAFTDEEIYGLFETCDINENMGMKFNEFIVLLCLVYLLKDDPATPQAVS